MRKKITEINPVRVKRLSYMFVAAAALISFCSCSSDDKDEPEPEPGPAITDVYQKDKEAGSISQKEFEEKVMNKLWCYDSKKDSDKWIDINDNGYDYSDYASTGKWGPYAYFFGKDKYTYFTINPVSSPYQRRTDSEYSYDPSTGMVYSNHGYLFDNSVNKYVVFYIESVNETEMVVHDEYINHPLFQGIDPGEGGYTLCSRRFLKAVSETDAQKDWWDKYTPIKN